MAVDLSIHDGQYTSDPITFDERERSHTSDTDYLIFSVRQGSEEFRYFMHFSEGLSPDYIKEVGTHFSNFGALLQVKALRLPAIDEEE